MEMVRDSYGDIDVRPLAAQLAAALGGAGLREIQELREEREKLESDFSRSEHWGAC